MANPLDTDAGSELFSNYEAELKLVQADLNQKLDQIEELSGEERKSAIRGAERALDEARELVFPPPRSMRPTRQTIQPHTELIAAGPTEPGEIQHPHLHPLQSEHPLPQPPIRH